MNKKIIIFMPSIEGGGVEKNLFLITNYLSKKLNNITLITASKEFRNKFRRINYVTPSLNLSKFGRKLKYLFCLYELMKLILFNKETLVFSFQANVYCILIAKLFKCKIIIRSNSSPSGWSKNFFKRKLFKLILGFADTIIVNSNEFKKEFKKQFSLETVMIYNPLNKNEIISLSKKKVKLPFFNKKSNNLKIINIGRMTYQKNQMMLLKAVNLLKKKMNIKLLIIGRGELKNNLKTFIIKNKLNKIVKLMNFKKNPFPYLKKSNLFVLTSNFEGLPNVLLEAATLKKFIISTNCPTGPKEILKNGKNGILVKMNDYKNLAEKINFFNKNKKKFKKEINYNFKSLNRFDYNNRLKEYKNEINKLLN